MRISHSALPDGIDTLIRFFLYVLVFWLPYSPAVVESCVIICVILWFIKRCIISITRRELAGTFKERLFGLARGFKPESSFLNKPITFFLLACILSVTASAFFAQSLHNFFTKTLEWFAVYFLVIEAFKKRRHIYIALAVFLFTAFSTAADSLVQYYVTHKDIFSGVMIDTGGRATAGFKTSNGLGGYLAPIVPCLFASIVLSNRKFWIQTAATLTHFLILWSLFVTFSRGAWLGAFFGMMFLLLFVLFPKAMSRTHFYLGLWVTVFFCIVFFLVLANHFGVELLGRYATIRWRLGIWSTSLNMIKDKLFFGHGINTFMRLFQVYRGNSLGPTYAHNCYIQLAAETGVVGLCCFLWIIRSIFRRILEGIHLNIGRDRGLGALMIGLLSGIFAYLVHSFFDNHFYSLQLSVYLWFMVGMLAAIGKISDISAAQTT